MFQAPDYAVGPLELQHVNILFYTGAQNQTQYSTRSLTSAKYREWMTFLDLAND